MRRCRECGAEKLETQFAMPGGKPSSICRVCYAEDQLGISAQRPSRSDRSPRLRTRPSGDTSGDTYALWEDAQWMAKKAAASLAERGRHELALQKRKELRKEKRKERLLIARYVATNLDRMAVYVFEKVVLPVLKAPFELIGWMWRQLMGK